MKTKRWHTAGFLAVMVLAIFTANVFAEEVGDDAGVKKETMFTLIQKGGPIMWPLGLCSILALALGMERFIALRKERVLPVGFIDGLLNAWSVDPSGKQAVAYCDESGGAVGHIFKAGVQRAKRGQEAVEKGIEDAGSREADRMKRSLRPISIIATISPLLGLLGTVYGMINAFQKTATSAGGAKPEMLAIGIYEALVTTAAGLTIAIPVLLLYQFLLGRVDRLIDDIDEAGTEFIFSYTEGPPNLPAGTGGPAVKKDDSPAEQDDPPAATVATAGA